MTHLTDLCPLCPARYPMEMQLDAALTDDATADAAGRALVDLLELRIRFDNGRIETTHGDRTPAGLARIVARFLADAIDRHNERTTA